MGYVRQTYDRVRSIFSAPAQTSAKPAGKASLPSNRRRRALSVVAAQPAGGAAVWGGSSDDFNREYATALQTVIQRAQDLDVNNPDVRGAARQRCGRVVGPRIVYKSAVRADETGLAPAAVVELNRRANRYREIHSRTGGFDATGAGRTEAKLQEIAFLTHWTLGTALVHRVWKPKDLGRVLPLAVEIIPGSRLETPVQLLGDPKISYGIRYTDDRRTEIVGYFVRKPNRSMGANSFVWDFQYDYLPAKDVALLRITEIAGLDRSLPASVAVVRMLRNKGEFMESAVEAARAQAKYFAAIECAPGQNPWDAASDDASQAGETADDEPNPPGLINLGGVQLLYTANGEKFAPNTAKLPDPDYTGFMGVADARCARGLNMPISAFTRKVESSYSAGRQEEQQDDPIVKQIRESFTIAWNRVHEWFTDALYLQGLVEMPDYARLRPYYCEARITPPGKEHINPVDTANARKIGYGLRTLTPQQACDEDGKDLEDNIQEWADAVAMLRRIEKEKGLAEGTLDFLLEEAKPAKNVSATQPENTPGAEAEPEPEKSSGNGNGHGGNGKNRIGGLLKRNGAHAH